jgi:ketosteroid isomerase-like protein
MSSGTSSEMASTPAVRDIESLEDARYAAMLAADGDALDHLLSDDLVYMHSNGQADDKRRYIDKVRARTLEYLSIEISDQKIMVRGAAALSFGRIRASIQSSGAERQLDARFQTVWLWSEAGWRMVAFAPTPYANKHIP